MTVDLCTPDAQVQHAVLKQHQDYKTTKMKKVFHCQKSEFLLNSDEEWDKTLKDHPGKVITKIINLYSAHGTPETLLSLSLRILNAVTDQDLKRQEAQFWRADLVNKGRKVLHGYNKDLNRITKHINTIDVPKANVQKVVLRTTGGLTPHPTQALNATRKRLQRMTKL